MDYEECPPAPERSLNSHSVVVHPSRWIPFIYSSDDKTLDVVSGGRWAGRSAEMHKIGKRKETTK